MTDKQRFCSCDFRLWCNTEVRLPRIHLKHTYPICQKTISKKTLTSLIFNTNSQLTLYTNTVYGNDAKKETWRAMTSKHRHQTGILMHFTNRKKTSFTSIILKDFWKKKAYI